VKNQSSGKSRLDITKSLCILLVIFYGSQDGNCFSSQIENLTHIPTASIPKAYAPGYLKCNSIFIQVKYALDD
jgi:hypothetical protein